MIKPVLRRYVDFAPEDFEKHPLWICAYGIDQEKAWAAEVDETTYRPWTGQQFSRSTDSSEIVVRARFQLADGTLLDGFITPPFRLHGAAGRNLDTIQPTIFLPNRLGVSFWTGIPPTRDMKQRLYSALEKSAQQVFPIRVWVEGKWIDETFEGIIEGFGFLQPHSREIAVDQ